MLRHLWILIPLFLIKLTYASESPQSLLYTLQPGEKLITSFQHYFREGDNIFPVIKIVSPQGEYIVYKGKKHGPYSRISKRLFDENHLLILLELIDKNNRSFILTPDSTLIGPYKYIMDWKYNSFNQMWMLHLSSGTSTIYINGKSYGPYKVAWDLAMNRSGSHWSFIVEEGSTQYYVTDQWNQYIKTVKTDLDLYKPEDTQYFKLYRDEDWNQWVVVYEYKKQYFISTYDKKIFGPYDMAGEARYYSRGGWVLPVVNKGKYFLLDTGIEIPLKSKLLDQDAVYAIPGNIHTPYVVLTEKWGNMWINTENKMWGPYRNIGQSLDKRIKMSKTEWATTVQKNRNTYLMINGQLSGEFDSISDIFWEPGDNRCIAVASPPDDPWHYLYINGSQHSTAMKKLLFRHFISSSEFIIAYNGRDEKPYVESSDGRRWGPFQDIFSVYLSAQKPVFSVLEKDKFVIYSDGYPNSQYGFSLRQEIIKGSDKVHWIIIQDKNILYH